MAESPTERVKEQRPDDELLSCIARGDRQALSDLYDRYARQVYSLSLRMVENQSLAEEIAQDVFMTVWTRGTSYRSERGTFVTWLLSITHNRCIDELRKRRRRGKIGLVNVDDLRHELSGNPSEVTDAVLRRLDRNNIKEALNKLPPQQKQVISMAFFQGLTQSEISKALDAPLGTVKTRIRLGLQKMREHFPARREQDFP